MLILTADQLKKAMPNISDKNVDLFLEPVNRTFIRFNIDNLNRRAAWLAQVGHESGSFKYMKELSTGERYDVGQLALNLGNTPEDDGDGEFYKGRGPMQITGKTNYDLCGKALGIDLLKHPEILEQPMEGTLSAGWFWNLRNLSKWADMGTLESFKKITKLINGGYNGLDDRLARWNVSKAALGIK